MKNLSTTLKRPFLVVGLMIAAILVCTPVGAGENGTNLTISGSDVSLSAGAGLAIPLTPSLSLDLRLSTIDTGQGAPGEKKLYAPPIPILKGSESDHYRLGAGLSFRF